MRGLGENGEFGHICVFEKTGLKFWTQGSGRMSGGKPEVGEGLGIVDGGSGCQGRARYKNPIN